MSKLHEGIMACLKKKSQEPYEYINPHFLISITESLEAYYECEDDEVDKWVLDMFSA